MTKFAKFLLLAWFLIAIDPKSLYNLREPEKMPPFMGQFATHLECDTIAGLLRISRPDWIVICAYSIYDVKIPLPPPNEGK